MSDVLRTYNGKLARGGGRRRKKKRPGGCLRPRRILFLLLVLLGVYIWWSTRDTRPITEFIPANQKYSLVFTDLINTRSRIAGSKVWQVLPDDMTVLPEMLGRPIKLPGLPGRLPDWVPNNLFHESLYVTGNDVDGFTDFLVLTKMSRVGDLLEQLHFLVPEIQRDRAGGLGLRYMPGAKLYYAVRGRVLMLSPSRDALVEALTLSGKKAADPEAVSAALANIGREDVRGTVALRASDPWGGVLDHVRFAARIDPQTATITCRARFRDQYLAQWQPLVRGVSPRPLVAPPGGMLTVSADFGKPVEDVYKALCAGLEPYELSGFDPENWEKWQEASESGEMTLPQFMTMLLGGCGPGIRISWHGIDLNEIFPMPEVVGTFEAPRDTFSTFLERAPELPGDAMPWASYPRLNEKGDRLYLPMIGGPSLEPAAVLQDGGLLVSNSRFVVDDLLTSTALTEELPLEGNLYVRIRPYDCVARVVEAGRLFVEQDGLRGFDSESYERAASQWMARAAAVEEAWANLAIDGNEAVIDINIAAAATASADAQT